jgi:hypothetical protein
MGPVVTPDRSEATGERSEHQAAPRPNSFPLDSAVDALIAQARAEEREAMIAVYEQEVLRAVEHARAEERAACDRRAENWALRMESMLAAERARVLAVIAQVRDSKVPTFGPHPYQHGWRAACDAIAQAMQGGSDA